MSETKSENSDTKKPEVRWEGWSVPDDPNFDELCIRSIYNICRSNLIATEFLVRLNAQAREGPDKIKALAAVFDLTKKGWAQSCTTKEPEEESADKD